MSQETAGTGREERATRRAAAEKKKRMRTQRMVLDLRIKAFFAVFLILAVIGLLLPLRPKTSELEKRTLETWPKFTLSSFWDGSYFSAISTWYADTFPFRERLLTADASVKNLYGLRGEQIVGNGGEVADAIPEDGMMVEAETTSVSAAETDSTAVSVQEEAEAVPTPEPERVDGAIQVVPEQIGSVYVTGDTGFGLFYFNLEGANTYIRTVDEIAKKLEGTATVYDIVAPTSVGIMLSPEAQEAMRISLQRDAMDYVEKNIKELNSNVKCVNVYQNLVNHNSEYIYFRTDHHWTARGAYYAYEEFCKAKGITPTPIDEYETREFPDFLGTFYSGSNQAASLAENPDTVIAYVPKATNDMMFIGHDNKEYKWNVIKDVSNWKSSAKYNCFIGSDEPFADIENPNLSDGSAVLVVKESYGNAFVPFLVDHYQHTYVVDHRYFNLYTAYGNNITKLIQDKGIQDVILLNTTMVVVKASTSQAMGAMFK